MNYEENILFFRMVTEVLPHQLVSGILTWIKQLFRTKESKDLMTYYNIFAIFICKLIVLYYYILHYYMYYLIKYWYLDVSQIYGPPRPVNGIVLPLPYHLI
jgi:hypothetical protein